MMHSYSQNLPRLLLIILAVNLFCFSQVNAFPWSKGILAGSIKDYDNAARVLSGVKVRLVEQGLETVSGNNGRFTIKDIKAGVHTLEVSIAGYLARTIAVQIEKGKTTRQDISLKSIRGGIYSSSEWSRRTAARFIGELKEVGSGQPHIAVAFYLKRGERVCDLTGFNLEFINKFNQLIPGNTMKLVVRDRQTLQLLQNEISLQFSKSDFFDKASLVELGQRLGANVMIVGALIEKREFTEVLVNAVSVAEQALIPGISSDFLLKKGAIDCE